MGKSAIHFCIGAFTAMILLALVFVGVARGNGEPVKIGVLAKRGSELCIQRWSPTAEYLTAKLPGETFTIAPIYFEQIYGVVEKNEVDFILANSSFYVELESKYGANRIATLKNKHSSGAFYTVFGGVLFCRSDRVDIRQLSDLRGKSFMAVKETSFGGWRTAWRELKESGIHPYRDFKSLEFGGTHDAVVFAVRDGDVDAGTVRTDTLERMHDEGKINLNQFHIINKQSKETTNLPFLCSTRVYPE